MSTCSLKFSIFVGTAPPVAADQVLILRACQSPGLLGAGEEVGGCARQGGRHAGHVALPEFYTAVGIGGSRHVGKTGRVTCQIGQWIDRR